MIREDPDLELLLQWRKGDRKAGERLLAKHFAGLRRYFRLKYPDAHEDLLQETFSRIVQNRDEFRGESLFKTYLFRIARYVGNAHVRKHYRQGGDFSPASSSLADLTGRRQSSVLAEREDHRLLLDALQQLTLEQQEVIDLYYWEGLTAKQVGESIEAPESTVRSRLRLAVRRLTKLHQQLGQQEHSRELTEDDVEQWLHALRQELERAPTAAG
ncbi:RNA polymerase sigma factor [Paraliomyxa miuraensis]|uniref:RNA polymerase sigma factor n=1 Tax=Paraliomyxa miuraensis TaxID=376150 RepID=UPI002254A56F|nr:sigma-70 family RNA polymerase sigma factor [Paraliomyxa miuraensis]MCX4243944.1 sigma-70 family RNA polymerase sigma factor [Paraliomyxa miuraensis]